MSCQTCNHDPCRCGSTHFEIVNELNIGHSLVADLTRTVDIVRNIGVVLGARQYQVHLIWTRWSGGERGVGNEAVIRHQRILPTPLVRGLEGIRSDLQSIGIAELGAIKVSEISPRYTEDFLLGRACVVDREGDPIPDDVGFYWEIQFPQERQASARRRFTPKSPPSKHPTGFEWTIDLMRASDDRTRSGDQQ